VFQRLFAGVVASVRSGRRRRGLGSAGDQTAGDDRSGEGESGKFHRISVCGVCT
jgi:hypothetical protein